MYANKTCPSKLSLFWGIIPVYFVILQVTISVNYYIIFDQRENFVLRLISVLIFDPLAILTTITHLLSMFTSPGYVPIPFKPLSNYHEISSNSLLDERSDLFCKKCNNPRPYRSHHCKICGKCTLKMDHHCHWIANCVGYYNQKNFYQFLFYSTSSDLVAFLLLFYRLFSCNFSIKDNVPPGIKIKSGLTLIYYMWEPINIIISIFCSFAMTVSIGTLFYKQTWMLLLNQTTIDKKMYEDWENSPFYEEDKWKNFNSVMGNNFLEWISFKFYGNSPYNIENKKKYYSLETLETEN